MNRAGFLNKAKDIVCHDREGQYGGPEENFGRIAEMWTAYLGSETITISPEDVAIMMSMLKMARIRTSIKYKEDSWVDAIGYLEKHGEENVGRTLPQGYCYYYGNGRHNLFRMKNSGAGAYNFGLEDPYK